MKARSGDNLHITRAASVQFIRPIFFRVIRVLDWPAYDGWTWIDGYQIDEKGDAVARRSLFVMEEGLRVLSQPARPVKAPRQPIRRGVTRAG